MTEIWKDIKDYENVYQVSSFGNIRRWRKKYKRYDLLNPNLDKKGYYKIMLCKDSKPRKFWIHSLVACHFLNHTPSGMESIIDHIDNDRKNNHVDNLRIVSNRDNIIKGMKLKGSETGIRSCILKDGTYSYNAEIVINKNIIRFKRTKNKEEAQQHYQIAYANINNFTNMIQFKNLIYERALLVVK